ncbi:MAG: TAXI family TRAP transporter solute-binding subunit [Planctomycetota bacterium]|jgi:TRAP transporter TAXI family solute receptor
MIAFSLRRSAASFVCVLLGAALIAGCGGGGNGSGGGGSEGGNGGAASAKTMFLSIGTAPLGGTFPQVGDAIAQTLNNHKGDNNWKAQGKGTKGSQANIRGLDQGELQLALSNSAISYFAVRGESGWEKAYDTRAVVTLAPNVAMFVTTADSGIKTIAELKDKRVVIGPAGAGFDMFVGPILEEHGVSIEDDIEKVYQPMGAAVDMLADGSADAAFLGGAVPAAAISQACASYETFFIPFDPTVRQTLIDKYPFFHPIDLPGNTYQGHPEKFEGLNVGSMHLVTAAAADEEFIYQVTKTIWENRAEIAAAHGAGKAINEKNAARNTGTEFHPGAVRFYKEIGLIEGDEEPAAAEGEAAADESEAESQEQPAGDTEASEDTTEAAE